jgi:predicted NUDIX family NTP pyrophosphohydrolase
MAARKLRVRPAPGTRRPATIFGLSCPMSHLIAAGLLMYRRTPDLQFFFVHPGGPFFKNKDTGVWSIPKGLPEKGEELVDTAAREFKEETGLEPTRPYIPLGMIKQKGGKTVHCWAFAGEWDESTGIRSNTFTTEWPPRSGKRSEFPEQDKAEWMDLQRAKEAIIPEQFVFIERLMQALS